MAVNGGAMTISTSPTSFTRLRNSLVKTTASWTVLNIFQLPAMNGVLIFPLSAGRSGRSGGSGKSGRGSEWNHLAYQPYLTLFVRERRHPRERSAAEELERRSAARRDV